MPRLAAQTVILEAEALAETTGGHQELTRIGLAVMAIRCRTDALGFGVKGSQLHDPGRHHTGEPRDSLGQMPTPPDPRFVVPQQPSRHRLQLPVNNDHVPASRSEVVRMGIIIAVMNRENDATITGGDPSWR